MYFNTNIYWSSIHICASICNKLQPAPLFRGQDSAAGAAKEYSQGSLLTHHFQNSGQIHTRKLYLFIRNSSHAVLCVSILTRHVRRH